ncbi:zeatin O-glucosyltransferase-like [Aristolochia californica]|uniref:zeatin O-glucosyltransferase-like n=1 Tax=Aristolochia californica TaxID=171875 RepID=UPI0035DBCD0E
MESSANEEAPPKVVVLMVPLPAQGHLNQLINLSRLVSSAGVHVHFACSGTHNRQARVRVHGWDPSSVSKIHFHDLPFPEISTPPPDPSATLKFPAHLQATFDAAVIDLRQPLLGLLRSLCASGQRVAVIHDSVMSFIAEDTVDLPNAEAYVFHSVSAFAYFCFFLDSMPVEKLDIPQKLKQIYLSSPSPPLKTCFTDTFLELIERQVNYFQFDVGELYNTCYAIEGEFHDCLTQPPFRAAGALKTWTIGPLNSIAIEKNISHSRHKCMEWLDMQPRKSVIYISFGTMSSVSDEQIKELAMGLKGSNQRFLWVLREADRGDIFKDEGKLCNLPDDFDGTAEGMGMIIRDWAPQVGILAHPSTGGFMTHCGWNSSMESISMGVPVVAWPMASDQPRNAMLLTDVLKMGVSVRDWARWDQVVPAGDIEAAVRRLMETEEGKEMRKRAAELSVAVRGSLAEGGSSATALSSFIAHISR